jgi:ATP-binding cassette subfamily C exporter for protease/lipase
VQLPGMNRPVLNGINLELLPGRITTVMGPSGSGKTTLARCLAGLSSWQSGTFKLDGISAESWTSHQWSSQLGYLPQDIELLEGTIADNIARFSEVDAEEVVAAARLAGMHESILRLPQGYDTPLSESCHQLSGGQQQLLGLARAVYRKPALIVLDEPNSRLDEHGDARLLQALTELKNQGKTIVLISHRLNILRITDQLLILKDGLVAHNGARDVVMAALEQARQLAAEAA